MLTARNIRAVTEKSPRPRQCDRAGPDCPDASLGGCGTPHECCRLACGLWAIGWSAGGFRPATSLPTLQVFLTRANPCRDDQGVRGPDPMLFIVTLPLWLALIMWLIKLMAGGQKSAAEPMIARIITTPDGRVVTLMVPASEPTSVSIARLYPPGEGPPSPPPGQDWVNPPGRGQVAKPPEPPQAAPGQDWVNPRYAKAPEANERYSSWNKRSPPPSQDWAKLPEPPQAAPGQDWVNPRYAKAPEANGRYISSWNKRGL
jgi:hypothetical protein